MARINLDPGPEPGSKNYVLAQLVNLDSSEFGDTVAAAIQQRTGSAQNLVLISALLNEALTVSEQVAQASGRATNVRSALEQVQLSKHIRTQAHRAVLAQPMLDSNAVSRALGRSGNNAREAASKLRLAGKLLGVQDNTNAYLFPEWQIDQEGRRVFPVAAEINLLLDALNDPWGIASWWISPTDRLNGDAPKDLLGTKDDGDLFVLARALRGDHDAPDRDSADAMAETAR